MEVNIIDNPKPKWMPLMGCDIVDLPFNVGRDYTWLEIEEVIIQLSLAGCDFIRIFATSWKPKIKPFKKHLIKRKYSFFKPNPKWDRTLKRFARLLYKYHMRPYVDLYDNCSIGYKWNPFSNSIQTFSHHFYGYGTLIKTKEKGEDGKKIRLNEVYFMIKHWDHRIMACLDPAKDIVGLGNELRCPDEPNPLACREWAENWGVPRAKNILDKGFKPPIPFSGATNTAQKLFGYISAEVHPEFGWGYETSCKQIHGKGTPEHVEEWAKDGVSQQRVFSHTDDGVGTNPDSMVPVAQRGYCEIRSNGKKYACTADTDTRIKAVEAFIDKLGKRKLCHSIAFLPRSILYNDRTDLSRFDKAVDAGVYWRLAKRLWGVNIRRRLQISR